MRVVKPSTVRGYYERHPAAETWLRNWLRVARRMRWGSLAEVRATYPHADGVVVPTGNVVTVFNVGGNAFRLVVAIHYDAGKIYVRELLTHAEYDREAWKRRN